MFNSTKAPLTTWFRAMYLITQTKQGISSIELGRRLGVTQTTAWKIKTKLAEVMRIVNDAVPLEGRIEMDDAYLGGERGGGKVGRGSPGKKPMVAAVQTSSDGRPLRLKIRRIPRFKRARVKSLAKRIIAPGATVVTDGLGCFRGLADAGCTHIPITTGSGRKAARHPAFKWVKIGAEHTRPQTQGKACGNRFTRGAFGRAGHELAGLLMARSDFADTSSNASIARRKLALDWCADEAIRDKRLRFAALRPHSVLSILPKRLQGQPCGLGD